MRHLLFACSLSIVLPATIQAQIIREPVSLAAPVGQSAYHFSQEADGPDAAPAAEVHHVSERLPESATWGTSGQWASPEITRFRQAHGSSIPGIPWLSECLWRTASLV
jgi:hypothetical protein